MKLKLNMLLSNLANTFTKTSFPWVDPERQRDREEEGGREGEGEGAGEKEGRIGLK